MVGPYDIPFFFRLVQRVCLHRGKFALLKLSTATASDRLQQHLTCSGLWVLVEIFKPGRFVCLRCGRALVPPPLTEHSVHKKVLVNHTHARMASLYPPMVLS